MKNLIKKVCEHRKFLDTSTLSPGAASTTLSPLQNTTTISPTTTQKNASKDDGKITFEPFKTVLTSAQPNTTSPQANNNKINEQPNEKHEDKKCWYRDGTKLTFFVIGCLVVAAACVVGFIKTRGSCRCSGYEDIANRGLAGSEYQHNNEDFGGSNNKSYKPL